MKYTVQLRKMITKLYGNKVWYQIKMNDGSKIVMNDFVGETIKIDFNGDINCMKCGTQLNKTFGEGFCYTCFSTGAESSPCIMKPELCRAHLGEGRDMEWERKNHLVEQVVYLAKSSHIKVGITKAGNEATRWIDQGASEAMVIARVPNRYLSGVIEVALKDHYADKTQWQRMLKNEVCDDDLQKELAKVECFIGSDLEQYLCKDNLSKVLEYPVLEYPKKVKSMKLDKEPHIEKVLKGIKGQYLIFEDDTVINMRSHTAYWVNISV